MAEAACVEAAKILRRSTRVLVTAGAGMGVDSGLPDFRGPEGFWRAYPAFRKLGKRFEDMANPVWFDADPRQAWGFYGHRLKMYRDVTPHAGFTVLRSWAERGTDMFVFTSNVDGAFEKAGFDPETVCACHGSIMRFQCTQEACWERHGVWDATSAPIRVDPETLKADAADLPRCPHCNAVARPNILMFNDGGCDFGPLEQDHARFNEWCRAADAPITVVELGAGTFVPTVRMQGERIARSSGGTLIRINVREPEVPRRGHDIGIPLGAKEALERIDAALADK